MYNQLIDAIQSTQVYGEAQTKAAVYKALMECDYRYFSQDQVSQRALGSVENIQDDLLACYVDIITKNVPKDPTPIEKAVIETVQAYGENQDAIKNGAYSLSQLIYQKSENPYLGFTRRNDARGELIAWMDKMSSSGMNGCERIVDAVASRISTEYKCGIQARVNTKELEEYRSVILDGRDMQPCSAGKVGKGLHAYQHVGNKARQEDATLMCEHPSNPELKFMVLCDGVGGSKNGQDASQYAVRELKKWFESTKGLDLTDQTILAYSDEITRKLQEISDGIYAKTNGDDQTTFVGALIGKKQAIFTNIGDSRAYAVKGSDAVQITTDDSYLQMYKEELGYSGVRDEDLRFNTKSNVIVKSLGSGRPVSCKFYNMDKKGFDKILLCSDGVSDCMSREQIGRIMSCSQKGKDAQNLVEYAVENDSFLPEYLRGNPDFKEKINAGKDNTSAIVYDKSMEKKKLFGREGR